MLRPAKLKTFFARGGGVPRNLVSSTLLWLLELSGGLRNLVSQIISNFVASAILVIACIVFVAALSLGHHLISSDQGHSKVKGAHRIIPNRQLPPICSGKRFCILVARFQGDAAGSQTRYVIETQPHRLENVRLI